MEAWWVVSNELYEAFLQFTRLQPGEGSRRTLKLSEPNTTFLAFGSLFIFINYLFCTWRWQSDGLPFWIDAGADADQGAFKKLNQSGWWNLNHCHLSLLPVRSVAEQRDLSSLHPFPEGGYILSFWLKTKQNNNKKKPSWVWKKCSVLLSREVAGLSPSEALEWWGKRFCGPCATPNGKGAFPPN